MPQETQESSPLMTQDTSEEEEFIKGLPLILQPVAKEHGPRLVLFCLDCRAVEEALGQIMTKTQVKQILRHAQVAAESANHLAQMVLMSQGWTGEMKAKCDLDILRALSANSPRIMVPPGQRH